MDDTCIFCKIIQGAIPADRVYETDSVLAFNDISPVAPIHLLIIPKKHLPTLNDLGDEDAAIPYEIMKAAIHLGATLPELGGDYRLVASCGPDAGQVVPHIHFHLIGGRVLNWPPG